eukprot:sb/3475402/
MQLFLFRLAGDGSNSHTRLLGTEVSLIGPTTTTVCGTISVLNPGGMDAGAQTYPVPCPATTTLAVKLYDDEPSSAETVYKDKIVMNIAEVIVYIILTKGRTRVNWMGAGRLGNKKSGGSIWAQWCSI